MELDKNKQPTLKMHWINYFGLLQALAHIPEGPFKRANIQREYSFVSQHIAQGFQSWSKDIKQFMRLFIHGGNATYNSQWDLLYFVLSAHLCFPIIARVNVYREQFKHTLDPYFWLKDLAQVFITEHRALFIPKLLRKEGISLMSNLLIKDIFYSTTKVTPQGVRMAEYSPLFKKSLLCFNQS